MNTTENTLKEDLKQVQDEVINSLSGQTGNIQTLLLQMEELQKKIEDVKSLDAEVVVLYDGGDSYFSNKEKDFQLSGQVTTPTSILGNSITLKETVLNAATISLVAADDITIRDLKMDGTIPEKVSNYVISIHADDYVAIRDSILNPESAYNAIEIGLTSGLSKSVTIDNIDFQGNFLNNGINIFGMADNGVVTVSNCHFAHVSNAIRLSNRANTNYTVNIINCTFDEWETGEYGGMILLQDYTSTSAEEADENNQFAKITINIQNCTKPDGSKLENCDLKDICGTQDDKQIIYMWDEYRNHVSYSDKYPKINII